MFTDERQSLEQGDVFGFQLNTGNKLCNDVFCLGKTLTERGKEIAREIYQYSFPFPSRATCVMGHHAL